MDYLHNTCSCVKLGRKYHEYGCNKSNGVFRIIYVGHNANIFDYPHIGTECRGLGGNIVVIYDYIHSITLVGHYSCIKRYMGKC